MKRILTAVVCAAVGSAGIAGAADGAIVAFRSPSGNISCMGETTGGGYVRCDVARHSWRAPAKPASCEFDWGSGLSVRGRGRARWVCASDSVLGAQSVLNYGRQRSVGGVSCLSAKSGMRCVNRSGSGFFVSKERAYRFSRRV